MMSLFDYTMNFTYIPTFDYNTYSNLLTSILNTPIFNFSLLPTFDYTSCIPVAGLSGGDKSKSPSIGDTFVRTGASGLNFNENMTKSQKRELQKFINIYNKNKSVYERIAQRVKKETGKDFPPELIAAIHYRESDCDFNTYLHNGQKLGKVTTIVPKGIYFTNFEDAAVDAIKSGALSKININNTNTWLEYAERFNGLGYRNRGVNSPYIWAGTSKYAGGMYVADNKYSSSAKDNRIGVAVMLKGLKDNSALA